MACLPSPIEFPTCYGIGLRVYLALSIWPRLSQLRHAACCVRVGRVVGLIRTVSSESIHSGHRRNEWWAWPILQDLREQRRKLISTL